MLVAHGLDMMALKRLEVSEVTARWCRPSLGFIALGLGLRIEL